MKIQRLFGWVIGIGLILIASVLWLGRKPVATSSPIADETNTVVTPSTRQQAGKSAGTNMPASRVTQSPQTKAEEVKEGLAALNDEDILFFGKVIDQFNKPVAKAAVAGSIQINNGTRVGGSKIALNTDDNGLFTISGYKGKTLGIWINKNGYVMAAAKTSFIYSLLWPTAERYTPDPNNPVIFKMWKLQGAEPLVRIDKNCKLPYTNIPISFDLLAGQVVPDGGDLKITVNRPTGEISQQHPQGWSIHLEAPQGGFIETSVAESRQTFSAPEAGYVESGDFSNNNGPDLVDHMFFIKSRGGQIYAKLRLTFRINNTPDGLMSVTSSGVANPNGSHNWEATAPQ